MRKLQRRTLLKTAALAPLSLAPLSQHLTAQDGAKRKKLPVAAVVTVYKRNSHADVIIGKILEGFEQDGGAGPDLELAAMYVDQTPKSDLSRGLSEKYGFPITKTIEEAITLGSGSVQVAGVLLVGEHGDYPYTEDTHQHMYPRRRLFDGIAAALKKGGQVVPVFNDKHLSYRWTDALHMYQTAQKMKMPLMAGSSLPVAWREPLLSIERGAEIEQVVAVGYGGVESYGFHALEMLQCLIERRGKNGETGVAAVEAATGDAVWQAQRDGRWSRKLLEAALDVAPSRSKGELKDRLKPDAPFYLLDYRDGLRATVAMASGVSRHFSIALKLRGRREPVATWFKLQDERPYGHFGYLLRAIEAMIHSGRPSYPVERTLLTTGILDRAMHSLAADGKRMATPELAIKYEPADWPYANQGNE